MTLCCGKTQQRFASKILSVCIAITFSLTSVMPGYAQSVTAGLPSPSVMLAPSGNFNPVLLRAIEIDPQNPLHFGFIVDSGDTHLKGQILTEEAKKLIRYFLASLTTPEKDMWVNLSPYEKDRIIEDNFSQTQMGRDLLAQDYILKQLTASLIYPEDGLGKKFWDKVYKTAYEKFGTTNIPVDTFNKIWILPKKATVYEHNNRVFVVDSELAVLMEEDYLALQEHQKVSTKNSSETAKPNKVDNVLASQIVREVVLPAIEKEVNFGKNFANLRQVYSAMILATWYKNNLKESLLGKIYVDQSKIKGIDLVDRSEKEKIYKEYLATFQKGVYNFVKVERDQYTGKNIPRKYFSGGFGAQTPDGTPLHAAIREVTPSGSQLKENGVAIKFDANLTENETAGGAAGSTIISGVPSSESAGVLLREITAKLEETGKILLSFSVAIDNGSSYGFSLSDPYAATRLQKVLPSAQQVTMYFKDKTSLVFQKDILNSRWKITRFSGSNFDFTDSAAKQNELGGPIKIPQIRSNMDLSEIRTQIIAENIAIRLTDSDIKNVEFYKPDQKSLMAQRLSAMPQDSQAPLTLKIFVRDGSVVLYREKKAKYWQFISQSMPIKMAEVPAPTPLLKGEWSFSKDPEYIGVVELRNDTQKKVNLDDLLAKSKYRYLFDNGILKRGDDGHLILDNVVIVYTGIGIDDKGTDLLVSSTKPVSSSIIIPVQSGRKTASTLFTGYQVDPMRLSAKFKDGTIRSFIVSANLTHYEEFTDYATWGIDRALPTTFYYGWSETETPEEIYAWDKSGNGLFLALDAANGVYVPYRSYGDKYQEENGVVDQDLASVDGINGLLSGLLPASLPAHEARNKAIKILNAFSFVDVPGTEDILAEGEFSLVTQDGKSYLFGKDEQSMQWVLKRISAPETTASSSPFMVDYASGALNVHDAVMALKDQIPHKTWSVELDDSSYLEHEPGFEGFFKGKNLNDGQVLRVKFWSEDRNAPLTQVTVSQDEKQAIVTASRFAWNDESQSFKGVADDQVAQKASEIISALELKASSSVGLSKTSFIEKLNIILQRAADEGYQYSIKGTQSPSWPRYEFSSYAQFLDAVYKKIPDGKDVLNYIRSVEVIFTKGIEKHNATIHFSQTQNNVYYRIDAPLVGEFGRLFADFHSWRTVNRPSRAMGKSLASSAITLEQLELENFSSTMPADAFAEVIVTAVDELVKSEQISKDYIYILFDDGRYVAAFKHDSFWQSDIEQQHAIQDVGALIDGRQNQIFTVLDMNDVDAVTRIVNEINALKIDSELMTADNLESAPVDDLSKKSIDPQESTAMYLEGKFVPHFNYGGAATRLGLGSMYDVKIREVAKFLIGEPSTLTEKQKDRVTTELNKVFSTKEGLQEYKERVRRAYERLDPDVEDPGMGPRQIIAYRIFLEKLAKANGRDVQDVLSKAVIVVHFNDMIFESASQDLLDHDFYGFNRDNVFILTDRVFRGSSLDEDGLVLDAQSKVLPPGHGYALEQFNKEGHVYQMSDQGKLTAIAGKTLLGILDERGAQVIRTQRINDLTMWTEAVGSVERLAYFLEEAKDNNATVGIELVGNPTGQKGGSFVRRKGDAQGGFLVEGLALQTPDLKQVLVRAGETRAPYNAFRNYYTVKGLADLLNKVKLPRYLRYSDNRFYTEMVTGDVTQLAKKETVAFVLDQEELIHDLKNLMNIEEGLEYARKWEDMVKGASSIVEVKDDHVIGYRPGPSELLNKIVDPRSPGLPQGHRVALEKPAYDVESGEAVSQDYSNPGGIDMSSSNLDLQIKRDGNGIPLPISQQPIENMNIQGFNFQIMNITPVPSLFSLSGLEESVSQVSLVN